MLYSRKIFASFYERQYSNFVSTAKNRITINGCRNHDGVQAETILKLEVTEKEDCEVKSQS